MADEARADLHHGASRCLLGLFDAAAGGLVDWSEFDAETERWGIEVRGLSREDLSLSFNRGSFATGFMSVAKLLPSPSWSDQAPFLSAG
jgi:hypothetical protein